MGARAAMKDVAALLFAGGLTIETEKMDGAGGLAVRTVVQIDGDMIVYVDADIGILSDEWRRHSEELRERISAAGDAVRQIENRILDVALVTVCIVGYGLTWIAGLESSWGIEWWGPPAGAIAYRVASTYLFPGLGAGVGKFVLRLGKNRLLRVVGLERRSVFADHTDRLDLA